MGLVSDVNLNKLHLTSAVLGGA